MTTSQHRLMDSGPVLADDETLILYLVGRRIFLFVKKVQYNIATNLIKR